MDVTTRTERRGAEHLGGGALDRPAGAWGALAVFNGAEV